MSDMTEIMLRAKRLRMVIPSFNIPYLPMMRPIVTALRERRAFGLIAVARLEWIKFGSGSQAAIADEYRRQGDRSCTRLHQDHVPAIDEDGLEVDFMADISNALALGYDSVMFDGSRLSFSDNTRATAEVCRLAHHWNVPVEAELGAVMGHEAEPTMTYDEIFDSRHGFTDPAEAKKFVSDTGVDWLSVAVGSIHGSINPATKGAEKPTAKIDIDQLAAIHESTDIPLVLHGGSGIPIEYLRRSFENGISKLNIAADLRRPYEAAAGRSEKEALEAVRRGTLKIIDDLRISDGAKKLGTWED